MKCCEMRGVPDKCMHACGGRPRRLGARCWLTRPRPGATRSRRPAGDERRGRLRRRRSSSSRTKRKTPLPPRSKPLCQLSLPYHTCDKYMSREKKKEKRKKKKEKRK